MRGVIIGIPASGKTTLANRLAEESGIPLFHTDDLLPCEWDVAPEGVIAWMCEKPAPWLIEGVTVARALKRWVKRFSYAPCDRAIVLHTDFLGSGRRVGKGLATTTWRAWAEAEPRLISMGVDIVHLHSPAALRRYSL